MQRPRILSGRRHRCEPDLPIDTRLIRRDERRSAVGIAGLGFELVLLPFRIAADYEKDLESDKKDARDMSCLPRSKRKPWHDQFDEVVPCRLKFVEPKWREMQIATDR